MNLEFQSQCGVDTNAKLEFPWMVTLFNANSLNGRPFCGGSLLSAIVVLTAAHCIQNLKPEDIVIRAGQQRDFNSSKEENYQERNVAEIIIYEHFLKENFYNDLALLILNKSLIKSNNIETVCVPTNMDNINFNNCLVTTWGMQKNGNYSTVFKEKHISVFTNTDCQNILKTDLGDEIILHNSFFCTVENFRNNSICSGDGGSPLVCPDNFHRYFQVGIVSWSPYNCEDELKTKDSIVYTNLTQFSNWIDARLIELGYGAISS
ncbi:phenoloxidase-activating factor 2-like [Tribolium madens]|uniref:phenoloxidase-activating factor 2-like n=1 Tax=Tribolium madens TaxID=41895 RepID=UPI001CF7382C|nr:phenoloxidase-activating factor 2-like [Tribolium madens]